MRTAVCSIALNEEELIGAHIDNWKGLVDKHLVLCSTYSWRGDKVARDNTAKIAREHGAEVIEGVWETEGKQRTQGLQLLEDYDYVLIVDPDEFYTKADQKKIIDRLKDPIDHLNRDTRKQPLFVADKMTTYWKTLDYVFDPPDLYKPAIAVDPKRCMFTENREIASVGLDSPSVSNRQILDVNIHHLSWVKSNEKVEEKIRAYSHSDIISGNWFNDVWRQWKPGSDMKIRPYGKEPSVAKYQPCPQEIRDLFDSEKLSNMV
jgi:hypothetical protein